MDITSEAAFHEIVMILEHGLEWAEQGWDILEEDTKTFVMKMYRNVVNPEKQ